MMNKLYFLVVCFLVVACANPAEARDLPVNEQIMYGEVERTAPLMEANEVFFLRVEEAGVTREQASEQFAELGWKFLGQGDVSTAARRFNQAWLLDPDNHLTYWAFGILAFDRDNNVDLSSTMFEKALSLKQDSGIYADYGRVCEMAGQLDKAIELFRKGLDADPGQKGCYVGFMRIYDAKGDWQSVRQWLRRGETAGVFSPQEVARYSTWISESEKIK